MRRITRDKRQTEEYVLFPEANHVSPLRLAQDLTQPWLTREEEGSLAVDVAETDKELIVRTAIAGVRPEHLELFVHNDMLTLRGRRVDDLESDARRIIAECHWGAFSRSLILPTEVDKENVAATFKDGVLTVRLPKARRPNTKIDVKEL